MCIRDRHCESLANIHYSAFATDAILMQSGTFGRFFGALRACGVSNSILERFGSSFGALWRRAFGLRIGARFGLGLGRARVRPKPSKSAPPATSTPASSGAHFLVPRRWSAQAVRVPRGSPPLPKREALPKEEEVPPHVPSVAPRRPWLSVGRSALGPVPGACPTAARNVAHAQVARAAGTIVDSPTVIIIRLGVIGVSSHP